MADNKRLEKLRAETGKSTVEQSPIVGSKLETLSDEMKVWCRARIAANPDRPSLFDDSDWKPRDPIELENQHYDWYATQPQPWKGSDGRYDWENFRVGRVCDRDRRDCNKNGPYAQREAIPRPKFPSPGQPSTPELWESFWQDEHLWSQASNVLEYVIRLTRIREEDPEEFDSLRLHEAYAADLRYLTGIWNAKHLPAPSDEQFKAWAFPEKPAVVPGKMLVTYTTFGGNKIHELEDAIEPQPETK